jgi:glycosyltransferase involved in cell wall biosynthesis
VISGAPVKPTTILAVGMLPPPLGGQALMFKRAVEGLSRHYDVKVIDIQFQKNLGESGSFSVRKVLRFFTLLFFEIIPTGFRRKFDIVYYCLSGPSMLGLIKDLVFLGFLRRRARKTVYHFHGAGGVTFLMQSNALLRTWARLVLFEPDLVLRPPGATSDDAALCRAKREIVVNNAIEDPILGKCERKWPDGDLSFAFIGLVTEEKGVFDLVEIARLLRDGGRRFTMSIVGEGTPKETARLRALIDRYDLTEFVRLPGVLVGEPKFKLLQETTIYLFPSYFRAETHPTAIMEALALGVPVVASDWRAINTIVDHAVSGYLVPPRQPAAFYQAIETILTGGQIDRMREAARRIFLERFTIDRHIDALRLAFKSLDAANGKQSDHCF